MLNLKCQVCDIFIFRRQIYSYLLVSVTDSIFLNKHSYLSNLEYKILGLMTNKFYNFIIFKKSSGSAYKVEIFLLGREYSWSSLFITLLKNIDKTVRLGEV